MAGAAHDLAPLKVDIDLRDRLPDLIYQWTTVSEVNAAYAEMVENYGVPPRRSCGWEPLAAVRRRALRALAPYTTSDDSVPVVCHEVLIHALTGIQRTGHAEIRVLAFS